MWGNHRSFLRGERRDREDWLGQSVLDILDGRTKRSERNLSGVEETLRDTLEGFSQNSTVLPIKKAEKGECERTTGFSVKSLGKGQFYCQKWVIRKGGQ